MRPVSEVAQDLVGEHRLLVREVVLDLDGLAIGLRSNSARLLDGLERYFAHVLGQGPADLQVLALESTPVDAGTAFADWTREPGKTGRKDAFVDLSDGRLVRKVRTGMLFVQSEHHRLAVGPCLEHPNQVINFVNAQYMNWLQNAGALLCHAAGLVVAGRALGIAGFSGGGKSTLMLKLLDAPDAGFLTNDRLFLKRERSGVQAIGIPKLPRVNPGTVVHDERLRGMLSVADRDAYLAMPASELWELEHKYDVDVTARYGAGKIAGAAPLSGFVILAWQRGADGPTRFEPVSIDERPDLLGAVMKSPGPFFQRFDGSFLADGELPEPAPYRTALAEIPVFELSGAIDFTRAAQYCLRLARS